MVFECKTCKYLTEIKCNIERHNQSKSHLKLVEISKLKQKKPKNIFDNLESSNINQLEKELNEMKVQIKDIKKDYEYELKIKQKEIEKLESINKILLEQKQVTNYNIKNNINSNNNTGIYSYVAENFKNAPPLRKLDNFVIGGFDPDKEDEIDKFTENIIHYKKIKGLGKLLGQHLVDNYKKNKLEEQSFYTTDVSRLNYIVKLTEDLLENYETSEEEIDLYDGNDEYIDTESYEELKEMEKEYKKKIYDDKIVAIEKNNDEYWFIDKHGHKISKFLIEPLIRKVTRVLKKRTKEYLEDAKKHPKEKISNKKKEHMLLLSKILDELDSGKLKKDINKFIAPYFSLDKKK